MLAEITVGLKDKDRKLQSDCIEVFTLVAEKKPEHIVPFADNILPLLHSKNTIWDNPYLSWIHFILHEYSA